MHSVSRKGGGSADSWTQDASNGAKTHSVSTVIRGRSEAAKRAGEAQYGVFSNGEDLFMTVTLSSNGAIFMPDNPSIRFRNFEGTQLVLQGTSIGRTAPLISDQANTTQYVAAQFLVLPGQIDFFRSGIQSIQITTAPKVHEVSFRKDRIGLKLYKELLRQSQNTEMK